MTARLRIILDDSNSRLYRPNPDFVKQAVIKWEAGQYRVGGGGIQQFDRPHMLVLDPCGDYGVDLQIFFATHEALPHLTNHYIKSEKVRAWCADNTYELVTVVDGKPESVTTVEIGAFVVQNPGGEQYTMDAVKFQLRYLPV